MQEYKTKCDGCGRQVESNGMIDWPSFIPYVPGCLVPSPMVHACSIPCVKPAMDVLGVYIIRMMQEVSEQKRLRENPPPPPAKPTQRLT